jgi:Fe-S-cluster-containing dehydrogenase component
MKARSLSRRAFLRCALGAGAAATGAGVALGSGRVARAVIGQNGVGTARYALVIDTTRCVGCGACKEACHIRNRLPEDASYIHILSYGEQSNIQFLPVQCQHCAHPPCASVCPVGATYRREDGVVLIDEKLCVGCKYCEVACPYQARIFDEERGVADKCWLCLDYVLDGKQPACVEACILGARHFGRQDDPNSEVAQLIASGKAKPLHPEFGTEPGILYYIMG